MAVNQIKRINYTYAHAPTIQRFAKSNAFFRGLRGPFGSGKSSGSVIELIRRASQVMPMDDGIRRSRFSVIRNTAKQLRDTTIKTVMDWVPEQYFGTYRKQDMSYTITALDGLEIEIIFRALDRPDQVDDLLSLELTGAWVNEAREIPWEVIKPLMGRVGRYPPEKDVAPGSWFGMWGDTNPPDNDSWWYKMFETDDFSKLAGDWEALNPGRKFCEGFAQPSGLSDKAENLPFLKKGYYELLAADPDQDWVKVHVHGEYGFLKSGKPVYETYRDNLHCVHYEPVEGLPIYRGWDFGLCYTDDTEVLTKSGWKLFKDVDVKSDLAATRNPITGEFEYTKINFKIDRPYTGKMLEWANTEINFCVTPEHRVPFTYRDSPEKVHFKEAKWLADNNGGHHYVDVVSKWGGEQISNDLNLDPIVYAELMGLYLSEGSSERRRVVIYQNNQNQCMQSILDKTDFKWIWFDYGKSAGWRMSSADLAGHFSAFGKAGDKFIPECIRFGSKSVIKAFIASYTAGDGHIRTRENGAIEHTVFTISCRMADDFQDVAQKVGWNASIRTVKPQVSVIVENGIDRKITGTGGYSITFKKRAKRAELLKRNFKSINYTGRIYCLNVPYHTLYVRRNGKAHWNGNTPAVVFAQLVGSQLRYIDEIQAIRADINMFSDEVIPYCQENYRHFKFIDFGDPSGDYGKESNIKSCFEILKKKGIEIEGEHWTQTPSTRTGSVTLAMNRLVNGEPGMVVSPKCKLLRKGFQGGYHYKRKAISGDAKYHEAPDKNKFSHTHDSAQYIAVNLFGQLLLDGEAIRDEVKNPVQTIADDDFDLYYDERQQYAEDDFDL